MAPADGTTITTAGNIVRLMVRGSSLGNVELLPAEGYAPTLGRFTISGEGTVATLDFNTRNLPNGVLRARIVAFDKPAGSADAREIVAMEARTWTLANSPEPSPSVIPAVTVMPEVHISLGNLPYVDPAPLTAMLSQSDAAFGNMLQSDWPRVQATLYTYAPAHVLFYPPTPRGFYGPWASCLDRPSVPACREAMMYMEAVMRNKQG